MNMSSQREEVLHMGECRACKSCELLYKRQRDRESASDTYIRYGKVECSAERYKGRKYMRKYRTECQDYDQRESKSGQESEEGS
jgi:hypothetical protein